MVEPNYVDHLKLDLPYSVKLVDNFRLKHRIKNCMIETMRDSGEPTIYNRMFYATKISYRGGTFIAITNKHSFLPHTGRDSTGTVTLEEFLKIAYEVRTDAYIFYSNRDIEIKDIFKVYHAKTKFGYNFFNVDTEDISPHMVCGDLILTDDGTSFGMRGDVIFDSKLYCFCKYGCKCYTLDGEQIISYIDGDLVVERSTPHRLGEDCQMYEITARDAMVRFLKQHPTAKILYMNKICKELLNYSPSL